MTRVKKADNDKSSRLKEYGAFNPHPEKSQKRSFRTRNSISLILVISFRLNTRC